MCREERGHGLFAASLPEAVDGGHLDRGREPGQRLRHLFDYGVTG